MTDRNDRSTQDQAAHSSRTFQQRGNIFFALFGAVAVMGVLGAGVMTFMKGPLQSSVRITKMNTAENQMNVAMQALVSMGASNCDADPELEPIAPGAALTGLTGGGQIPASVGTQKTDPWGTPYGYCSWNHGTTTTGCAGLLAGKSASPNNNVTVVAIISAGPNKQFNTSCNAYAADATPVVVKSTGVGTDDMFYMITTQEAVSGGGGGLWTLASATQAVLGGPTIGIKVDDGEFTGAVITNNIEPVGLNDRINFNSPLNLKAFNDAGRPTCNAGMEGGLIINNQTAPGKFQRCVSSTWTDIGGSGGGTPAGSTIEVQFKNGAAFGADANFTWDAAADRLKLGNVTTPDARLDVLGDVDIEGQLDVLGASGSLNVSQNITYVGTITDVSDIRMKENIRHLSLGRQLDKLASLNGYAFSMKGDPNHAMEYGLMAQEVEKVYPELVIERTYNDQQVKTLNVQGMVAPMLEGIKELKAENDRLRKRLDKLERREAARSH